jgi:release factor glutamine methyltransferase
MLLKRSVQTMNNITAISLDLNFINSHQHKVACRAKDLIDIHRQHDESYKVSFHGLDIQMIQEVFCPAYGEGSHQLADCMNVQDGEKVLEIGTGAGALAILAAEKASAVTATDISSFAVACARQNIENHQQQHKIDLRHGDLFEPLTEAGKFSLIIFNLPFMEGKPQTPLEFAMYDQDYKTMSGFLQNVHKHLSKNGRVLIAFSTVGDIDYLQKQIKLANFNCEEVLSQSINGIDFFTCKLWL